MLILVAVVGFGFSANAQKKCIKDGVCYVEVSQTSSTTVSIAIDDTKNQRTVYVNVEQKKDKNGGSIYEVWCTGLRKEVAKASLSIALNSVIGYITGGTSLPAAGVISAISGYAYERTCNYLKENNY
jgi:hypothetical protein